MALQQVLFLKKYSTDFCFYNNFSMVYSNLPSGMFYINQILVFREFTHLSETLPLHKIFVLFVHVVYLQITESSFLVGWFGFFFSH